jgi:hypothetical protein
MYLISKHKESREHVMRDYVFRCLGVAGAMASTVGSGSRAVRKICCASSLSGDFNGCALDSSLETQFPRPPAASREEQSRERHPCRERFP